MKLMAFAGLALVAFIAIWFFIVAPAEKSHHERKLEAVRKRIEKREMATQEDENTDPNPE